MIDPRLRAAIATYARRLHERGWVANHDGNATARLAATAGAGRYLATPTATSKADVSADSLIVVDEGGAAVQGSGKAFSEIGLHLAVYRARPDVGAVIHAHPPTATGFSVAGVALERPMIAEAVVSLGQSIPTVPFAPPGDAAARAVEPYAANCDAVLLQNHGVLAWGKDIEQAYLRLELVEHLARIALVAQQLGGIKPLPASVVPALLEGRRKAGLGAAASTNAMSSANATTAANAAAGNNSAASGPRMVDACAPAPPGSDVVVYERPRQSELSQASQELATIIREEIAAALKK